MKVIAHRGASLVAPENTMAAFISARSLGAHGVEFDVRSTTDGQLAVMHDFAVDRTTNGTGLVAEMTAAHVATLDAGSWHAPEFAGEKVPFLEDVLSLQGLEFEVELKGYGYSFLNAVIALVERVAPSGSIEFTSSNLLLLQRLKELRPSARIGLFTLRPPEYMSGQMFEQHVLGTAETAGADIVHVYSGAVTARIVDRLHQQGFEVHANDAETAQSLQHAHDVGADRTTTSDIALARALGLL